MSAGFILIMIIILIFAAVLTYGFAKENKVAEWEQRTKKKICRYIYNKIVEYENWRVLRRSGIKEQEVINALFENAYHYYDGYKTIFNLIGDEDHDLVKAFRYKTVSCFLVINDSGLGDLFLEFVENKQKNNRVSGN